MKTVAALALLAMSSSAFAIDRLHHFSVDQDTGIAPQPDAWTVACSIQARGISRLKSYWGDVQVAYEDANGVQELANFRYTVSAASPFFGEDRPGESYALAKLQNAVVHVTISAYRNGPLYQTLTPNGKLIEGGTFRCKASIIRGLPTADPHPYNYIHVFDGTEKVGL